ncbi:tectonic-1 isoform X1 [Anolis sagrei]|uniref:tectonic-1 isoform X1 n=1 Tax=Anolis sagrei TaxID=38937 RepID=UPI00352104C4
MAYTQPTTAQRCNFRCRHWRVAKGNALEPRPSGQNSASDEGAEDQAGAILGESTGDGKGIRCHSDGFGGKLGPGSRAASRCIHSDRCRGLAAPWSAEPRRSTCGCSCCFRGRWACSPLRERPPRSPRASPPREPPPPRRAGPAPGLDLLLHPGLGLLLSPCLLEVPRGWGPGPSPPFTWPNCASVTCWWMSVMSIVAATLSAQLRISVSSLHVLFPSSHKDALSFLTPDIPTSDNFDKLLEEFNEDAFDLTLRVKLDVRRATDAGKTSRYQYKDPIQTPEGFLRLPAPLFFSWCTHDNPAGFLVNQAIKCNTAIQGRECTTLPALSMAFYANLSVLAVPNSSKMVNVTIQSITVQMLGGLRTRLNKTDVLMLPTLHPQSCSNVVLEANYLTTFTEAGEITGVTVSLVLGTINATALFVQQIFGIHFTQQDTQPIPLSGSPGYLVGQPVRAGFRSTSSGVIQSLNEKGQLTILKSTPAQDCLAVEGVRTPVLFGYNMMSGCQLRITKDSNCELLAPAVLTMLKGPNFPDSVASFGDSLPQNGPDWIEIINNFTKPSTCEIPISFEFQVQWTKYGSLVNPQVKIVCLTATVLTSALPQVGPGNESTIQIHTIATFVDVSAPAKPGYKALPSIEASLPFDFFFPFV